MCMVFESISRGEGKAPAESPDVVHEAKRLGGRDPAAFLRFLVPLEDFDDFELLVEAVELAVLIRGPHVLEIATEAAQGHLESCLSVVETLNGGVHAPNGGVQAPKGAVNMAHERSSVLATPSTLSATLLTLSAMSAASGACICIGRVCVE
jgi:hypothetical protein